MAQLEKLQETAKLLASFDKNLIQTADVPAPVKENS